MREKKGVIIVKRSGTVMCGILFFLALFAVFCVHVTPSEAAEVFFVTQDGAGSKSGKTWGEAMGKFQFIQSLAAVQPNPDVEYWVAAGTYIPTGDPTARDASFVLKNGVALYGGFAGTESSVNERDWKANETILSGEIQGDGTATNNSCHVVYADDTTEGSAVLDGFVVTGGYADCTKPFGGGMYSSGSPKVANCTFRGNRAGESGGGFAGFGGSPVVSDCVFHGNFVLGSGFGGGAMFSEESAPSVTGCTFSENRASVGGGMGNNKSDAVVTNCIFINNRGEFGGGGMANVESSPAVSGCTFSGNRAQSGGLPMAGYGGGGMFNLNESSPTVTDCTFTGNVSDTYGGGICSLGKSEPSVNACTFSENLAVFGGGGMANGNGIPRVTNCTFYGNKAGDPSLAGAGIGAAMLNIGESFPVITNCTFFKNEPTVTGAALANLEKSGPAVSNCIFWGSPADQIFDRPGASPIVESCVVEGGYAGGTFIITGDPLLEDAADNGGPTLTCAVLSGSSAIDAGTAFGAPAVDQRGEPRPQGTGVDIGAYESPFSAPQPPNPTPPQSSGGGCSAAGGSMQLALLLFLPVLLMMRP
ncbi:choice-of-anchor Q domain-containing protein [Aminivibrio sp.]|uniref:choice-of-anchor Q domain-containing protein n=1 Tax=Aminivibrio sp. TaxID=1872489 RepID=UPI00345E95DB